MTLQGFMWVQLYKSSFDMRRGQLTRITFHSSLRWKESILSSRDLVNVHISEFYKKNTFNVCFKHSQSDDFTDVSTFKDVF